MLEQLPIEIQDAVHTYSAGHTAALRQAKKANETGKFSDLKEAYFLEGFALHYLTDLFSTGHMRDPRRILHRTWTGEPGEPGVPEFWPADRCSQRQHDEDCANGLWVQNQRGDAWPAYGDKQLFTGKSAKNLERTVRASQSGVDEVWKTYQDGIIPPPGEFEALKRVCFPLSDQSGCHADHGWRLQSLTIWISRLTLFLFLNTTPTFQVHYFSGKIWLSAMTPPSQCCPRK